MKNLRTFLKGKAMTKTPEELTKAWKAGKLLAGDYYIKFENGEIERQNNCIGGFLMSCNNRVVQVLAPVPTYDEYKAMQKRIADQRAELESVRWYQTVQNEDIGKLRGLLKECLPIVSAEIMTWQIRGGEESYKRGQNILTRINAALGESEE